MSYWRPEPCEGTGEVSFARAERIRDFSKQRAQAVKVEERDAIEKILREVS